MLTIESCPLPANALLNRYTESGAYTDCYQTEVSGQVSHEMFVTTFYTTFLFRLERLILKILLSKPSSDDQVIRLANGEADVFAAWFVEERSDNQILLSGYRHLTRSWLMVEPAGKTNNPKTTLYFGSAVVPQKRSSDGTASFGRGFSVMIGFHKIYSVLLLYFAKRRLKQRVS